MAEQNWWQRVTTAINREYERRVRAASLVTEYGADQHHHTTHDDAEEAEAAVIVNIPRGAHRPVRRPEPPTPEA